MGRTLNNYRSLFESLKGAPVGRVYCLYGPEEYLKGEFVSMLLDKAIDRENRAFNLDVLYGDEFDRHAFEDRVCSFPLFTQRRVVILKRFDRLAPTIQDFVIGAGERLGDGVTLVVETPRERLDTARLKRLGAIAQKSGAAFGFAYLDDSETSDRARRRFESKGNRVTPEAIQLLVESVGTKLSDLSNEIDKITLYVGEGGKVDADAVSAVVGRYRTENVFGVVDALAAARPEAGVRRLIRAVDAGEEPVFVLAMLLRRVTLLLEVRVLLDELGRRPGGKTVAARMVPPISPYFAEVLIRQATRLERPNLEAMLVNLRWCDLHLKSSSLDAKALLIGAFVASKERKLLAPARQSL